MIFKTLRFLILSFLFSIHLSMAQDDGLDENSFNDQDPNTSEQPAASEENLNQPVDDFESPVEDLGETSVNPALDKGAIPENEAQEILSDEIKNLNPDSLTVGQEFYPAFIYEERGRKDPFAPVLRVQDKVVIEEDVVEDKTEQQKSLEGLAKFEVSALSLTAILMGKNTKPKALIKDPTGTVYQIFENDIVGRNNGIVKKIRQGQIVIVEFRDQKDGDRLYTTQVLSLGK